MGTVGSKQTLMICQVEAFGRVEHRYESGTASEFSKRALFHWFVQRA